MTTSELFSFVKFEHYAESQNHVSAIFNINLANKTIPMVITVDKRYGHVNLTKIHGCLCSGIGNKNKFDAWTGLMETCNYLDSYCMIKYGHLLFTYQKKHIYTEKGEFEVMDAPKYKVIGFFKNTGSKMINRDKLEWHNENNEVISGEYNSANNNLKGLYGEFEILPHIIRHVSLTYECIIFELMNYIKKLVSEMINEQVKQKDHVLNDEATIIDNNDNNEEEEDEMNNDGLTQITNYELIHDSQPSIIMADEGIEKALQSTNAKKGHEAEINMIRILKPWFKDIESCSYEKKACDLISPSLKTRFEIKCHSLAQKSAEGIRKFHRDVVLHAEDTNLFVYIDISPESKIFTHFEVYPSRFYINANDFTERLGNILYQTAENYNKQSLAENKKNVTANILMQSTTEIFEDYVRNNLTKRMDELVLQNLSAQHMKTIINQAEVDSLNILNQAREQRKNEQKSNEEFEYSSIQKRKIVDICRFAIDKQHRLTLGCRKGVYLLNKYNKWAETHNASEMVSAYDINTYIIKICHEKDRTVKDPKTKEMKKAHCWVLKKTIDELNNMIENYSK